MLSLRERLAVVNLYEELGSYRAVAALVGCDHKTVKAWLEREKNGETAPKLRPKATDPYLPLIRSKVAATQGKIKSKPLLRVLRAAGYQASLRVLQRALKETRQEWAREHRRIYRPWVSAPGEFLIVDWGEVGTVPTSAGERKLLCFCAVLGWSRWKYVRFFTGQRFPVLAQGLAGCFEALGGLPAHVLFDNPKTVTVGFVAGAAVLNAQLVRLATHYRFNPVTAAPNAPECKGKVEALVKFVKANLPPAGFRSVVEANAWAEQWCAEVNGQVHAETRAVPAERLLLERPLLRVLPERAAQATGEVRKVDRLGTVRFGSARYSVPWTLVGLNVELLVDGNDLRVLHRGAEVALHHLQPPGSASIQDEHYPTPPPTGVRPLRPKHPVEVAFLELGPAAEGYLRAAAAAGTPRLHQQLRRLLELAAICGTEPLQAALVRACQFGRFGWDDVRSILAANGSAPPAQVIVGMSALPVDHLEEPLEPTLLEGLKRLKLRRMRQLAPQVCLTARTQRWRPEEVLRVLIEEECRARDESNRLARHRLAGFPVIKDLASFDLGATNLNRATFDYLASLEWVPLKRNVVLVGPPGTGRTHLAIGLARSAIDAGHRVKFFRADVLVEQLYRGLANNTVSKVIDAIVRAELVVIDELGFTPLDLVGANHLFRLVSAAYETRSLIVTSNWPFEQWTNFLPDVTAASAILDRVLHHCEVVVLEGDSYRLREAKAGALGRKVVGH